MSWAELSWPEERRRPPELTRTLHCGGEHALAYCNWILAQTPSPGPSPFFSSLTCTAHRISALQVACRGVLVPRAPPPPHLWPARSGGQRAAGGARARRRWGRRRRRRRRQAGRRQGVGGGGHVSAAAGLLAKTQARCAAAACAPSLLLVLVVVVLVVVAGCLRFAGLPCSTPPQGLC